MLSGRVAHYEIAELLGTGGIGEVYRARDLLLDRWVAIKVLRPERIIDARSLPRFRREALIAGALNHPYICSIHELIEDGGRLLIVMELVEGETLADRLARGPLSLSETLRFGCEMAEGLAVAHARGLVHRDIKPSNVMITAHTHVKLMDFGLAKPFDPEAGTTLQARGVTLSGEFVGTLRYMAPEQAAGDTVDTRSDVFALGVVLYECLTGRLPYAGHSNSAYLENLFRGGIQSLARMAPQVPASVRAVVLRCLAHDPADRYPSAAELLADLRHLQDLYATGTWSGRHLVRPRRRWATLALIGAAALVAVAAASMIWSRVTTRGPVSPPSRIEALVTWPTFEDDGRVSPDGQWSSFLSDRDGSSRVWVRRSSAGEPRPLDTPPGRVVAHIWSPESDRIACAILQDQHLWLYVVPAFFGGTPSAAIELPRSWRAVRFAGWTAAGPYVENRQPSSLWQVDLASNDLRELEAFREAPGHLVRGFAVDRAGSRVLFTSNEDGREDIWVANLDGSNRRRVTDDAYGDSDPVWLGRGDEVLFQSNRGGQIDIWRQSIGARRATQVTFGSGVKEPQDASNDGALLIFQQREEQSNLWSLGASSSQPVQLTADALSDAWPSISSDGRRLVFQRLKSRFDSLYAFENTMLLSATLDAGALDNPVPLAEGYGARLSPDGRWLAFLRPAATRQDTELWVADVATHQMRRLTRLYANPGFYLYPFDPGGTSLAWRSSSELLYIDGSTDHEIRRWRPAAWGSEPEVVWRDRLPRNAPPQLAASPDGTVVAFVAASRASSFGAIGLLDPGVRKAIPMTVPPGSGEIVLLAWRNPQELLAVRALEPGGDATGVVLVSIGAGLSKTLAQLDGVFPGSVRYAADQDALYLTRLHDHKHGLYEYDLQTKSLRPRIPPEQPGITFGGLVIVPGGLVIFSRQQVKEDIWTIRFGS